MDMAVCKVGWLTRSELERITTDEERLKAAAHVAPQDYMTLHDWATEAKDPQIAETLNKYAVSAYHRDNPD